MTSYSPTRLKSGTRNHEPDFQEADHVLLHSTGCTFTTQRQLSQQYVMTVGKRGKTPRASPAAARRRKVTPRIFCHIQKLKNGPRSQQTPLLGRDGRKTTTLVASHGGGGFIKLLKESRHPPPPPPILPQDRLD